MPHNFCTPAPAKTPGPGSFPHEAEGVTDFPGFVPVPAYAVLGVLNVLISVFCGIAGTGISPEDARIDTLLPAGRSRIILPPFLRDPGGFP
jgi:hypothetical protein